MTGSDTDALLVSILREPSTTGEVSETAWRRTVETAGRQGCEGLLHHLLRQAGSHEDLPEDAAVRLRAGAAAIAARSLRLATETRTLLDGLEAQGIPAIPIRGPVLSEILHGDPALRPSGDVDLVVREEHLESLPAFFDRCGYRMLDRRRGFSRRWYYTMKFYREDAAGWIICEPHWSLGYPPFMDEVDMDAVWGSAARRSLLGGDTLVPAPEGLLLHLALHYIHHEPGAPLLWAFELERVAQGAAGEVSPERFLDRAGSGPAGVLARRAFEQAAERTGGTFPSGLVEALPSGVMDRRQQRLLSVVTAAGGVDGRESLATFLALPGLLERARFLGQLLFPSPRFMRVEYALPDAFHLPWAYLRRLGYFFHMGLRGIRRLLPGA